MAYTVFFREDNAIFPAATYIDEQLKEHQQILQVLTDALATNGVIKNPLATKTVNGDWCVMLKDEHGGVYTYSLFISRFEADTERAIETPERKKELMVIDPAGPKDSVGGYHPGYWTVAHYASLLEEQQATLFLNTIHQIEQNIRSDYYTFNSDGSIAIHIHKEEKAYSISVNCRAEWK